MASTSTDPSPGSPWRDPKSATPYAKRFCPRWRPFTHRHQSSARGLVLTGSGGPFCAGLDLSEHVHRAAETNLYHAPDWHQAMERIQFGGQMTVTAPFGAVIGGGPELAAAKHVPIADPSTTFQLAEARRGMFVGGATTTGRAASPVRIARPR
ncbi:MAG: enoyl-CoA hydratase-related protein [Pseudomonadota bacterium]